MHDDELESALKQFEAAEAKLESLIVQTKEVIGTMGLLVLAIRRLLKDHEDPPSRPVR